MPDTYRTTGATCLVVDDHPLICQGMRQLFEADESMSVVGEARCGEHALDLLRNLRPDVALIDTLLMTTLDGFQTTEKARDEQLATRIVIYSNHGTGEYVRRAFNSGAYGYVTKTSPAQTVLNSLHAAAEGCRYVDPAIAAELIHPSGPVLSRREQDVLELLARGMQNDGIAFQLEIATETVKTHVSHLLGKLGVQSRAGAVAEAFRAGLIT